MHSQHTEVDAAVSKWMANQGWNVTMRHYDFDRDVLAWRAGDADPRITLRITLSVCEDVRPDILVEFFDAAQLRDRLERAPDRYTLVMQNEATGETTIGQFPHAP